MEKKQFDNELFRLYSPDSLNYIFNDFDTILSERLEFYKSLFDIKAFRKIELNFFDDIEKFRNFIYELRGEKKSLTDYARGTYDNGMINAYINPKTKENTNFYYNAKYMPAHELFHIMYKELILDLENKERVVWFDEGCACLFSGGYDKVIKYYDLYVKDVIKNTKKIPNLNGLSHGNSFKNEDYNGYDLSYIAVKYIYNKIGKKEFKKLLHDVDKIREYGNSILNEIFLDEVII